MVSEPSTEQLNEALDRIHDIASKAALVEGMPAEVEKALDAFFLFAWIDCCGMLSSPESFCLLLCKLLRLL